jgi:Na+/melibiose symporter-like transporter
MFNSSGLWRNRDFLCLWAGQTISTFGTQATTLALPLTAIILLNATPFQMGLLAAMSRGSFILVGLFAGVWVDRFRRRPIMIGADLGRAVLLAGIPIAALLHSVRIELLYMVAFLIGGLSICADIAFDAYLPALVDREWRAGANGAGQLSQSVAEVAGPGIAGVLIRALSAPVAIAVDAMSYLVSVISLALIHAPETGEISAAEQNMATDIGVGLRVLFSHPWLRAITVTIALVVFFASMFQAVFVLYLDRTLHLDAGLIGIIFAMGSAGGIIGAMAAPIIARRMGYGRAAVVGEMIMVLGGQGYVLVALTMPPHLFAVILLTITECFVAGGNSLCNVAFSTIEQHIVPIRLLGRTGAALRVSALGVTGLIGAVLGGLLGSALSPSSTIVVSVTTMVTAVVWIWRSPLRTTRDLPQPLEEHQ